MAVMKVFTTQRWQSTKILVPLSTQVPTFTPLSLYSALLRISAPRRLVHCGSGFGYSLYGVGGHLTPAESIGSFPITCESGIENKSQFLFSR